MIIFNTQILELKLNKAIGIMSVFGGNFRTVCHRLDIDVYTYTQDRTFDPGHLLPPKKTTIAYISSPRLELVLWLGFRTKVTVTAVRIRMRTVRVQGKVRVRVKFGGRCRGGEISHIYLHTCTHTHARGQGLFQVSKRHHRCARLAFSGAGGLRRLEVLVGRILTLTPTLNPKPEPGEAADVPDGSSRVGNDNRKR